MIKAQVCTLAVAKNLFSGSVSLYVSDILLIPLLVKIVFHFTLVNSRKSNLCYAGLLPVNNTMRATTMTAKKVNRVKRFFSAK